MTVDNEDSLNTLYSARLLVETIEYNLDKYDDYSGAFLDLKRAISMLQEVKNDMEEILGKD